MTFFIDPYKNYYEKLKSASSLVSEADSLISKVGEASTFVSNLKSAVSSSGWEELGISELTSSTIPNLASNISTLQSNIEACLKAAASKAIGELYPETEKLKTEDENYEEIKKQLDALTPVSEDKNKTEYQNYISKKSDLEQKIEEARKKCLEYISNCGSIVAALKALDGTVADFPAPANDSGGDGSVEILDPEGTGTMYKIKFDGSEFLVAKTKLDLFEYETYLVNNKITQRDGYMSEDCNLLSYQIATDLMSGTMTSKSHYADNGSMVAIKMSNRVTSASKEPVMQFVYEQLSKGIPVAVQVTQRNSYKGWRHFVTFVGYDDSVKSYKDLEDPHNILVLDCVDGKVQRLSDRDRNFYNQGNTYYAIGPSDNFLNKYVYANA